MAAIDQPITLVVNVSVSATPLGLNAFNTSNLAIFTGETPGTGFGSLGYKIYLTPPEVAADFGTSSVTYQMAVAVFSAQPNILAGGGYLVVVPLLSSETLAAAITRTENLVQYFGIVAAQIESQADTLAAAAVVQTVNKILFIVQNTSATIAAGGTIDLLRTGSLTQTRGLYYGDTSSANLNALLFGAAYASRALSVNFLGSNTTITMHLKNLVGVQPDPTLTLTQLTLAIAAGADTYPSIQGIPKVFCSGANSYYDEVYNLGWFVGAIQVAGFNYLAQSATKIPQTENGMDGLKSVYRGVCSQAVTNAYSAPGSWTSATTFGVQADLLANVSQFGYYIYSTPIALQSQAARAARSAPLVQIALKEAGAIHSSSVVVNVNQ